MSTTGDIIRRATELVDALNALIESDTARALPAVARQLNVEEEFNRGLDVLVGLLEMLAVRIRGLANDLAGIDALGGLAGMLQPLVGSLGRLIGNTGQDLDRYGLRGAVNVTGPISQGLRYVTAALAVVTNTTEVTGPLMMLADAMGGLADRFMGLRTEPQLAVGFRRLEAAGEFA